MKITREHYNALKENFLATRHLMSDSDCETMRAKINEMRMALAFESCKQDWLKGETINCGDFLKVCETAGVNIPETVARWIVADLIEVGKNSYSCMGGKLHKRKETTLQKFCQELTEELKEKA